MKQLGILLKSTHPPKKLAMVPAVHTSSSGPGRLAADISFENETDTEITVYPINSSGKRNRGRKIAPGKSFTFNARIGGAYVVEGKDGTIHEIYSPSWPPRPVVIRKQLGQVMVSVIMRISGAAKRSKTFCGFSGAYRYSVIEPITRA